MTHTRRTTKIWMAVGGLVFALLLAAIFTLGSLRLPTFVQAQMGSEVLILWAVTAFLVVNLLVFGLVLARSLLKLQAERRARVAGSRFKTRMVIAAMSLSLLPLVFLFIVSYALLNRTLVTWFPRPLEMAAQSMITTQQEIRANEILRIGRTARAAANVEESSKNAAPRPGQRVSPALLFGVNYGTDAAWLLDSQGKVTEAIRAERPGEAAPAVARDAMNRALIPMHPIYVRTIPDGPELWRDGNVLLMSVRQALPHGALVVARITPDDYQARMDQIETQISSYEKQRQGLRTYKFQMIMILLLFTLLLLFAATWFALFLSKQLTVPIQALAEATRAVSAGNFDTRVDVQARDELGLLVNSFNQMTAQLADNRRQLDQFTRSLQQAVQELEQRRTLLETILESIPTGVISLSPDGAVRRVNPAGEKMFGPESRKAVTLEELMGDQAAGAVRALMRRALRMGAASQDIEIFVPGRLLHTAVTVSALGPRRSSLGYIVVVDDLTELLGAQKAAAWQEVAQRIAHEIKNPLTPIQLSAQRLTRFLDRKGAAAAGAQAPELARLAGECASLIQREVTTLESLVKEFSDFARFPTARLEPLDPNAVVLSALEIFSGRLDGIRVRSTLEPELPAIRADAEQLRRVLVNLIDNAAESMEGSAVRELTVETHADDDRESVTLIVADSGHGISPEDKDKLFLPHFSTKDRGTGLGLAISSRIVAEHHGTLRVEDNTPVGARFILQIPVAEVRTAPLPTES
jgi:two-component system, NtrC family, nitrogen regulation sensor histidine kinase NtrY